MYFLNANRKDKIHTLYIKIQASSHNNRISFFKKGRRKKKTNIRVMCYGVSYVNTIKVRVRGLSQKFVDTT